MDKSSTNTPSTPTSAESKTVPSNTRKSRSSIVNTYEENRESKRLRLTPKKLNI
jgi:hypothetical protein